jgi:hypothetical protein
LPRSDRRESLSKTRPAVYNDALTYAEEDLKAN